MEEEKSLKTEKEGDFYLGPEAEALRVDKDKVVKEYVEKIKTKRGDGGVMAAYREMIDLTNKYFGELSEEEKVKHIMYHAFLGSSLQNEKRAFVFDDLDQEAEKEVIQRIEQFEK